MTPDNSRRDRRESDQAFGFLKEKIDDLGERLEAHVTDCAAQSRKLFWAVVAVLGWLIANGVATPLIQKAVGH